MSSLLTRKVPGTDVSYEVSHPGGLPIVVPISKGITDDQLREKIQSAPNGEYACQICRGCGSFFTKQDAHWTTAKIVDQCSFCI